MLPVYEPEKQLQFVSDAVMAFAYAFKAMHKDLCQSRQGLCSQMNPIDGTLLLEYLKNVNFTGKLNEGLVFFILNSLNQLI